MSTFTLADCLPMANAGLRGQPVVGDTLTLQGALLRAVRMQIRNARLLRQTAVSHVGGGGGAGSRVAKKHGVSDATIYNEWNPLQ